MRVSPNVPARGGGRNFLHGHGGRCRGPNPGRFQRGGRGVRGDRNVAVRIPSATNVPHVTNITDRNYTRDEWLEAESLRVTSETE
jgi:hypothetical protein